MADAPAPLTDAALAAIEARQQCAWLSVALRTDLQGAIREGIEDCSTVDFCRVPPAGVDNLAMLAAKAAEDWFTKHSGARADIPALLAEVRRLREALDEIATRAAWNTESEGLAYRARAAPGEASNG